MHILSRIESNLYAIRDLLLQDEDIRKMLYYETPDALLRAAPSVQEVEKHVTIVPRVVAEEGVEYSFEHSFIVIYHSDTFPLDEDRGTYSVTYNVGVYTSSDSYLLDNRKIRPLTIQARVADIISRRKLSHSGAMMPGRILSEVMVKEDYIGLLASWSAVDRYDN